MEVPDPKIESPDDVIVRIAGAGVCRTDLHLIDAIWDKALGEPHLPYTIGHENAGWILDMGNAVSGLRVGDPVILHPLASCGMCMACRAGNDMHCIRGSFPGLDGTDGGFAQFIKVKARSVVRLPEGTDPAPLAPFADAGITAYHAIKKLALRLVPGSSVVVMGVGGLGHFAVQLLKVMTPATVIAVDAALDRLDLARSLGADHGIIAEPQGSDVANLLDYTDGVGADAVIDFVGESFAPDHAVRMLKKGGTYSIVGYGGKLDVPTLDMINRELAILGNLVGTYNDLVELMEVHRQGKIHVTTSQYALNDVSKVLRELDEGKIQGRAVLIP